MYKMIITRWREDLNGNIIDVKYTSESNITSRFEYESFLKTCKKFGAEIHNLDLHTIFIKGVFDSMNGKGKYIEEIFIYEKRR